MDSQSNYSSKGDDIQSVKAESATPSDSALSEKAATLIASSSSIFYALFILIVTVDSLPLRLLDPLWLIQTATSLTNTVSFPLAGLFFVHIAGALAPLNSSINQRRMLLSRLAAWAALAYLLLIPLLGFAVWRGIANVQQESARQISGVSRNADRLIAAIDRAKSSKELQGSMQRLQGPKISDQDLELPLDQIKTILTKLVFQLRQKFIAEIPRPNSEAYKPLYVQSLRASALALVSSIGFASLSWDSLKQQTLLQTLFGRQSGGIFGFKRGGLPRSIKKYLDDLKRSTSKDAVEAQRLSEWRRRQKDSDRAKKQLERSQSLRDREMKRNLAQQRKLSQQRERQRQLVEREARRNANKNNRNP